MAIKYSLSARHNPENPALPKKIYANAQYNELIDLPALARHIQEHGSPFTRDVIQGVLSAAVDCLREQLVAGNKVDFGDLGSFYVSLRSEGVAKAEEFNPRTHVKSVDVKWSPSVYFENLKDDPDLKWEFAITHKEMAQAKKLSKEEVDKDVSDGGSDNPGTGGDEGGGEIGG